MVMKKIIISEQEQNVLRTIHGTFRAEYENELPRWKLATDYVLPSVKYHNDKNEHARKTGQVEFLISEAVKAYMTLCLPMTKKWFSVKTLPTADDPITSVSVNVEAESQFKNFINLLNSSFYEQAERMMQHCLVFGQAVMYINKLESENKVLFRLLPMYDYRVYARDDTIYAIMWKKSVPMHTFNKKFGTDFAVTGELAEYEELWINTEEFPLTLGNDEQTKTSGWVVYSYRSLTANGNNVFKGGTPPKNSEGDNSFHTGEASCEVVERRTSSEFPFSYIRFDRRDNISYGLSPVCSAIDEVASWQTLEGGVVDGTMLKLNPPVFTTKQVTGQFNISAGKSIAIDAKDIRSHVLPLNLTGNAEVFGQQKIDRLEAAMRRFFGLEDLQFIANSMKQPTQGNYIETYRSKLDTIFPLIIKILSLIVAPFVDRTFTVFKDTITFTGDMKDRTALVLRPPILAVEEALSKLPELDLAFAKIQPFAQMDGSILDHFNFDEILMAILEDDSDTLRKFLRSKEEVAQIRENRGKAQSMLDEAQANKDNAQAEKNRAAAAEKGGGMMQPPQPQPQQEQLPEEPVDMFAGIDGII